MLAKTTIKADRKLLKEKIEELIFEQKHLFNERYNLLKDCIEEKVKEYWNTYISYIVLEKEIDGKWARAFRSYKEFMQCDRKLATITAKVVSRYVYYSPFK